MINKLKNISLYFTCISIIITSLFGVFKFYDFLKDKTTQIKNNQKDIKEFKANMETHKVEVDKLKLTVKKLRLKVGNGKKVMDEIIKEEEEEIKKRKRFLGIF